MKKLILFLILLSVPTLLMAQVSGKSKAGRLFGKKDIPKIQNFNKPALQIISPSISSVPLTVSESKLIIHGKVTDEYGVEMVNINSTNVDLLKSGEFFYEYSLDMGLNTILIKAENLKNQTAEKTINVIYELKNEPTPQIVITQPFISDNEYKTTENKITISGRIENLDNGILLVNMKQIPLTDGNLFTIDQTLLEGNNQINLKAIAANSKIDELSFSVFYSPQETVPVITILEPKLDAGNEIRHNESIITIRGKIEDASDIRSIEVNSHPAAILGKNEFFANVNLNDGINNIVISAVNVKGKSSEKFFRIITPVDDKGPEITILEPEVSRGLRIVRKKDVLNVKGKVYDRSGVLSVTVNNRDVTLLPNKEFSIQLYLGLGNNTITVNATDTKYNVSTDTFYVTRKEEQVIQTGKYIALVIGINSYDGYWPPLRNAVNDAKGLADVLKNEYLFHEVYTLLDEEATRKNIIRKFEWLINNTSRDDNILIFYAGHGQFKRNLNKGYWVPVDASTNSTADYISNNDIKTYIGGIPSKHTLLITDACFGGDIFRGSRTASIPFDPNDMTKYYREVYNKPSRLALTSGSLEEVSDAGKDNHSVFTYYLLKSLTQNNKKYLDAAQLFNDFRMAVVNNSDQTPQLQVVRDTNDEGGQFIFIKKD